MGLDRESLMDRKFIKRVMIIGNMEASNVYDTIREIDLLFINSWNELFCLHMQPAAVKAWMKENRTPGPRSASGFPERASQGGSLSCSNRCTPEKEYH
jgi:hypothetical protein